MLSLIDAFALVTSSLVTIIVT